MIEFWLQMMQGGNDALTRRRANILDSNLDDARFLSMRRGQDGAEIHVVS